MQVSKENMIAIPADPNDPEDRDVTVAQLRRARMGRFIRVLRHDLGMTQEEFSEAYAIPLANLRQYEIGRHLPPQAVRAYLKVIAADPEGTAKALSRAA